MLGFKKIIFTILLFINFVQSTELRESVEREDLYLMVGSTHCDSIHKASIFEKILSSPDIDFTYAKSFNGQATTIGPQDTKLPHLKHIVGDIRTYDFSHYNIKGLYLECSAIYEQYGRVNLRQILDNIYKHLDKEAKVEIECLSFMKIYNAEQFSYSAHEKCNIEHQLELIKYAIHLESFRDFLKYMKKSPDSFKKSNPQVVKIIKIQKTLEFYVKSTLTCDHKMIRARLLQDTKILSFLLRDGTSISLDYPPDAPFGVLEKSLSSNPVINTSGISHTYCLSTYLAQSLTGFVLYNLNVADELRFIKDYRADRQFRDNENLRRSKSFKNVVLERKENPHNHRRNVWIITATKS